MTIEPLPAGGDCRDGEDIAKINEIVKAINAPLTSSHEHLIRVERNEGGMLFDFSGLIDAILAATGKQI